ncbi:hypothetical protein V495_02252 [Pseudogymnoascus sp. VKM F-4514 (FW-929)]|nr:hypothetical protein V495_02252 [Pseudogymnoascus sp. VKM F-4514 (FW-929)]KFY60313.1 hypothetical protein V497_03730 [Pseudogymnoascus sp. VKM F-4516 (FW-969)]
MRLIITKQPIRTRPPRKPTTLDLLSWQTDPRPITRLSTTLRRPRIIKTQLVIRALRRIGAVPTAGRVGVGELTRPCAFVCVGARGVVGDAGHVFGAGGDFEAAGAVEVRGVDEGEGEGGEGEEAGDEHLLRLLFGV